MAIVQTITLIATQGQDSLQKSVYVSGDAKDIRSIASLYSGLQSGIDVSVVVSGLKSIYLNTDADHSQVKLFGLSGVVTFNMEANSPVCWWSGNGFTNPLANCSGNVIGMSYQQLSGFVSGTLSLQIMKDATP